MLLSRREGGRLKVLFLPQILSVENRGFPTMNKMGVKDLYFPIPFHSVLLPECLALTVMRWIVQKGSSSVFWSALAGGRGETPLVGEEVLWGDIPVLLPLLSLYSGPEQSWNPQKVEGLVRFCPAPGGCARLRCHAPASVFRKEFMGSCESFCILQNYY